jgi:hypothetical protein
VLKRWFHRAVLARVWATYLCMGLSFFVFGVGSLNLFYMLRANTDLLWMHGWQAVMDGGLRQLAELLFSGYLAMAAYVVFKACEHQLVHRLCHAPPMPDNKESTTS